MCKVEYIMKNYYIMKKICTKTDLLNFKLILLLAKSVMVETRLISNGLNLLGDIINDNQLITFLLVSNISEQSIELKTKKKLITIIGCKICST